MKIPPERLGHGIGLRHTHFDAFLNTRPRVSWVEAVSENFMGKGGRPLAVLEHVRAEMPVALHGVSLSIGSSEPLDESYLASLQFLVKRFEPVLVTDHLSWGRSGGRYVHDLWPLPFTEEGIDHVVSRVQQVQDRLGRRIALENVSSYVEFQSSTMAEWTFLAEIARRADCGILLDLNNVYVSARNHGFSAAEYVDGLPLERVVQIHLAGFSDHGTHLLDTHDAPVWEDVWTLYRETVPKLGGRVPTLIEWDDHIPPLERLLEESVKAARVEEQALQPVQRRVG